MHLRLQLGEKPVNPHRNCSQLNRIVRQTSRREQIPVTLQKAGRLLQDHLFFPACLAFVVEDPRFDPMRDFSLSLLVNRNTGRGKNAAIVIATGLGAIFINGALVTNQHGTLPVVAVAHQHVSFWQAWSGKQQGSRNVFEGLLFFRPDMNEHGRAATAFATSARHIDRSFSRSQRGLGATKPISKAAGRYAGSIAGPTLELN